MPKFVVKADPDQLWRFDPVSDAAEIAGFEIEAYCAEGAAMKVYGRGLASGLKNFVVLRDGVIVARLYPMKYPIAMLLDSPMSYIRSLFR